jgi:hypothetical protein
MKFWPQKKWKKIVLSAFLVILLAGVIVGGYFEYSVYLEVSAPTETLNEGGAENALVIYHPGLTDFAKNITYTYAEGLASAGWKVVVATASPQAPTDIGNYSLLVLCWPIYDFNPGPTITNHLQRIGNLNGIDTVIITIGGGIDPFNAPATMQKIVLDANGTIVQSLTSFRSQHNYAELQQDASKITP